MTHKYLLGICYTCQKCLSCFNSNFCKYNKNIKLKRKSEPGSGQQIYHCVFTPDKDLQTANQFLFAANTKFEYNSNFDKNVSFTFCSACNSKFQRLKGKDKLAKRKGKTKSAKMGDDFIDIETPSSPDEFSDVEEEEYDLKEIKLQIVIEKKGKKTSKTITIQPVEYINVIEKINVIIQKAFQNKNIKPADYSILYKAVNARGPSNELEDKSDFDEFIEDYKRIIAAKKKMSVIVVIEDLREKTKSIEKRSKVRKLFIF